MVLAPQIAAVPQPVEFAVVRGESELQAVWQLRKQRYGPRFPGIEPWWLDEDRDRAGHVFVARSGGITVATARIVPVKTVETELAELGCFPAALLGRSGVWELGRLTAVQARYPGASYARALFGWATAWAAQNVIIESVVSHCRRQKLGNFLAVGATVLDGPYVLPDRGTDYYTIHAEIGTVLHQLAALGLAPATTR